MPHQKVSYMAHSAATPDGSSQSLEEHLSKVASRCGEFASAFGAFEMGYVQGMAHDVGKANELFLKRLKGSSKAVDHKSYGARLVLERYGPVFGRLMAYAVAGHHGGLPDAIDMGDSARATLNDILSMNTSADADFVQSLSFPTVAQRSFSACGHMGNSAAFFVRMLFSCLVDADYLDTERHFAPNKYALRVDFVPLSKLSERFENYMSKLRSDAAARVRDNPSLRAVFLQRNYVKDCCDDAAALAPGFFSLQVPTGGGKTLSSVSFALRHAERYGMRRIVFALPFVTVTEQNADVLREALGSDAVLEHHSSTTPKAEDDDDALTDRLACENWSSAVIVTTTVQLFDSLFSNMPSKCRKLHNLAGSVIVLDEAQAIPDKVLKPCLLALWLLCRDYGCTVVLCTATQPDYSDVWPEEAKVRSIIPDATQLFEQMRRTTIHYDGKLSDIELVERMSAENQALCIVNTRAHAAKLFKMIDKSDGVFHLSARMCAEHRTEVLQEIRERLKKRDRCIVVATNIVEAGIDIDFPTVYRAAAGIDSIVQASGRCNREGRLKTGRVTVFVPECGLPRNWLGRMASLGLEILELYPDPSVPEAIAAFYRLRFGGGTDLDEGKVVLSFEKTARTLDFPFRYIGERFRLIDDNTHMVLIPYDETASTLIKEMCSSEYPSWYLSRLQRYSVGVYEREYALLAAAGRLRDIGGAAVLACECDTLQDFYSWDIGLEIPPENITLTC